MSTLHGTHITEAAIANGQPYITVTSDGDATNTHVRLSDGRTLGLVQSAAWSIELGEYARLTVTTIASPTELRTLLRDTTILVRPAAGYNPLRYLWNWTAAWLYRTFTRPDRR